MDYARPELADRLAAEYVSGTLRGPARRRFETLLVAHPQLRRTVREWEGRLMPLTTSIDPVPPPPSVWQGVQHRLWPAATRVAAAAEPWWRRLSAWRTVSGVATLAALTLAVLLASPLPSQPPVVIVLQATGAQSPAGGFVASVSADGRQLVTRPLVQQVAVQPDRVLELWSVPPQGAPRSLGLIKADGLTVLDRRKLPVTLLKGGTQALAVSVEPPGGSPTGTPTGPVVFAGQLQL